MGFPFTLSPLEPVVLALRPRWFCNEPGMPGRHGFTPEQLLRAAKILREQLDEAGLNGARVMPCVALSMNRDPLGLARTNVGTPNQRVALLDGPMKAYAPFVDILVGHGSQREMPITRLPLITVVTAGGSSARSPVPSAGWTGQYMYFATDPAFANNGSVSNLGITVEYFDQGTDAFRLEFDAQPNPDHPNLDTDPFTVSNPVNNGLIYKYNTRQWRSDTFALSDVYNLSTPCPEPSPTSLARRVPSKSDRPEPLNSIAR